MKKIMFIGIALLTFANYTYSQTVKLDTIYFDKNWVRISIPEFATFYRVYDANDISENRKLLRDYYITGELQKEGGYISMDKLDDKNTVFDGEYITYYKSGKIEQKGYLNRGVKEGEYTVYYENGLVKLHTNMKDGKANGILTQFNESGNMCSQIEMENDEPKFDYYILSNNDGCSCKMKISDNTPIWESPSLDEKKTDYRDGEAWSYYMKNGVTVTMTNKEVKDYGKWYQLSITIVNNSVIPVDFNPDDIKSSLKNKNGEVVDLEVLSSDQYLKKVKRSQKWNVFAKSLGESLAASSAGYSSSTTQTNTSYDGYVNSSGNAFAYGTGGFAYGNYNSNASFYGNTSSTTYTTSYDGAAAYQARIIASNRVADYENSLLKERSIKQEGYLRRTTIYPGSAISGYVNVKWMKGASMNVVIDINGAKYVFPWGLMSEQEEIQEERRNDRKNRDDMYNY